MINPDTPDAAWGTVETYFAPIHSAARIREVETVQNELDAGVEVDLLNGKASNGDGGNTALWFAAQGPSPGGIEVAQVLIAAGAVVNRQCEHGRTALHMAAAWGHLDVVRFLVENGANTSISDDEGLTSLQIATHSRRVAEAELKAVIDYLGGIDQTGSD